MPRGEEDLKPQPHLFGAAVAVGAALGLWSFSHWLPGILTPKLSPEVSKVMARPLALLELSLRPALVIAPVALAMLALRSWSIEGTPGRNSVWFYVVCATSAILAAGTLIDTILGAQTWVSAITDSKGALALHLPPTASGSIELARLASAALLPLFVALMRKSDRGIERAHGSDGVAPLHRGRSMTKLGIIAAVVLGLYAAYAIALSILPASLPAYH